MNEDVGQPAPLDEVRRDLAARIERLGITFKALAGMVGCNPRTITRTLSGETTSDVIDEIARAVAAEEARRLESAAHE